MPQVLKRRRIANPGSRHRRRNGVRKRMTAKQIKFFGTKAQRAALKRRRSNPKRRGKSFRTLKASFKKYTTESGYHPFTGLKKIGRGKPRNFRVPTKRKRQSNIGEILTILPANPGRKKRTVKSKGTKSTMARAHRRKRRNYGTKVGRSWSTYSKRSRKRNPGTRRRRRHNPATRIIYRSRRRNTSRRHTRRRNPFMGGTMTKVFGVVGGAAVTKVVMDRLPVSLQGGVIGYLSTAVVAMLQGKLIGKVFKSSALGNDMTIGGFTYLAIKVINDFMPSISLPFGLSGGRGMGILTPSSFYVPQVNQAGSMASFVAPAGLPVATGMKGLGNTAMSQRRMGRTN